MNRRDIFGAALALSPAVANASAKRDASLYRALIVIDGNAVADPLYRSAKIGPKTAARLSESGLTALKQTLGGTGSTLSEATADLMETKAAIDRNQDVFKEVGGVDDILACKRSGKIGVILSFESASMLEGDPHNVDQFASRGVRVMGLSYNAGSEFGGGTMQPATASLTALGREAVFRMIYSGVSVDLSHSNEATSFEALKLVKSPMLITHAGSAAVHAHPRNKSDELMRAVAASGGVVGIYTLSFLGNYPRNPTFDIFMTHLLHALNVCGEDHVGVGTDSFLMGTEVSAASLSAAEQHEAERRETGAAAPEELGLQYVVGLNGPDRYESIFDRLLKRGVSAAVAEKIIGQNFLRVFGETWRTKSA